MDLLVENGEGIFAVITLIATLTMCISWLIFARLSMVRIEKEIAHDGMQRPCPWDGVGGRAVWYAFAIGLPISSFNPTADPLINVPLVRRYAKPIDRTLGLLLVISGGVSVVLILMGALVFDFY
ncbi:hypothetical protein DES49_2685 [Halospina denitrificans]|uniref:Uncharacterized protein n=1 Tax=Halospina denitrificans TaxID=332522 RepID=A0A4R7JJY2_9GAMM|nr:hypothetical protein [Halospina denitrificans]TDT37726.1 hypothetical protein DES49_2685 [Halospina denitrificans]